MAICVFLATPLAVNGQILPGYSSPYPDVSPSAPAISGIPAYGLPAEGEGRGEWAGPPIHGDVVATDWAPPEGLHTLVENDNTCPPFWQHRTSWFGDFLYLKAREVDLPYATHVDGPINSAVPLAPPSVVVPDYEPGLRVGHVWALDDSSSFKATYWFYRSETSDSLTLPGGTGWVRPEVTHPDTPAADFDKLAAVADHEIDFQMVDVVYRTILQRDCDYSVNYQVGLRYAQLDQQFRSEFSILGVRTVNTGIQFKGLGVRAGLDGEFALGRGFFAHSQAFGNILAGQFSADYVQQFNLAGLEANTGLEDNRIVPQLELELGLSWRDSSGRLHVRAGYYLGAWFNIATTPTWIDAVQTNNATDVSESLLFDGMTIRAEYRF